MLSQSTELIITSDDDEYIKRSANVP